MVRTCSNCGSSEIDEDAARGDATCTACGTVLEESIVVTENQFQERAGGSGHTLVGQFVSAERAAANNFNGMGSQESREVTYAKGKKVIDELSSQLRINTHCVNTAFNFFKMCVSRNLTRGRTRSAVVAVCLYITCRLENTAHLLLDFSDVTQINVFDLGRNLNFIARSLRINLPATDPCLYIMRFACVLDFGDKQKEVVNLATRLVQRMKRDWMSTGRRPTGICGAALLIAARSLNFSRSVGDIVRVVHISETVIRKRLDEFSQTPSGSLTIDEFSTVDLEHSEDPPAYREARRKAREDQLRKEAEQAEGMAEQLGLLEADVEAALERKRKEKFSKSPFAKLVSGDLADKNLGLEKGAEEVVRKEILDTVFSAAEEEGTSSSSMAKYDQFRPSLESLGIRRPAESSAPRLPNPAVLRPTECPEFDEAISDSEIDSYILTESEVAIKTDYWMKANGEVMKAIEERRRERAENGEVKKKKKGGGPRKSTGASSVLNAMEKVIQEKKLSNKINYEMLKDLETMSSGSKSVTHEPPTPLPPALLSSSSSEVTPETLTKSEKITRNRNLKNAVTSLEGIRSVFDLNDSPKTVDVKPLFLKKEPESSNANPEITVIEQQKSTTPARVVSQAPIKSRFSRAKPIIGAKKLAALSDVKSELAKIGDVPASSDVSHAPDAHEATGAQETPEIQAAPDANESSGATETSEAPPQTAPEPTAAPPPSNEKPSEAAAAEEEELEMKPSVPIKSRYAKPKPNLKLGKPKIAPSTSSAPPATEPSSSESEPIAKKAKH